MSKNNLTFEKEDLLFVLDAIQLKLRYVKENSFASDAAIKREAMMKKYQELESKIKDCLMKD